MLFLALTVLFQTSFSLLSRTAQRHGRDIVAFGAIHHVTAASLFLTLWAFGGWTSPERTTVLLGMAGGMSFLTGFLLLMVVMASRGVALAFGVARLSVVIPAVVSIALWGERPSIPQAVGIVVAVAALILMGLARTSQGRDGIGGRAMVLVPALFLISGGSMLSVKGFQMTHVSADRDAFFLILFCTAAVGSLTILGFRLHVLGRIDLLFGAALGLATGLGNRSMLLALERLPASIVFPVITALTLALMTLFATVVWRERLGRLGALGIGLAVAASALIQGG